CEKRRRQSDSNQEAVAFWSVATDQEFVVTKQERFWGGVRKIHSRLARCLAHARSGDELECLGEFMQCLLAHVQGGIDIYSADFEDLRVLGWNEPVDASRDEAEASEHDEQFPCRQSKKLELGQREARPCLSFLLFLSRAFLFKVIVFLSCAFCLGAFGRRR